MIVLQIRVALTAEGGGIDLDRLEREDANDAERAIVASLHDLLVAVMQETPGLDTTVIKKAEAPQ